MKTPFLLFLFALTAGQLQARTHEAVVLVDTASVQCNAEVINRRDTIYSGLQAWDVACLQITTEVGFSIDGGADYIGQVTGGVSNGRVGAPESISGLSVASPNAASLGKFADIAVHYGNGLPQINIPIATVKEGELQLPIGLQYHHSGVKVEEMASWVGLGWSLNAGGVINRQVMGGPDESYGSNTSQKGQVPTTTYFNTRTGYYADKGFRPFVPFLVCSPPSAATPINQSLRVGNEFLAAALGIKDTEPDLFTFNVAGYTGKFYFDTLQQVHLLPQQDVQIEVDFDPLTKQFDTWTLVTPEGIRYHFGENNTYETSRTGAGSNPYPLSVAELRASWLLTRVESADRQRNIYLSYTSEQTAFRSLAPEKFVAYVTPYEGPTSPDQRINTTRNYGHRLSQIRSSSTEVNFLANTLRQDVDASSTAKRLDAIQVKARNQAACLRYQLQYDYLLSTPPAQGEGDALISTDGSNDDFKRLRLLAVQEYSCDLAQSKPAYSFQYAGGVLPRRLSYQRDHWGYFNGRFNNNSLIPSGITNSTFINSNRQADATLMRRGHLTQITYPTGGFTRFTMQAHQSGSIVKGGLRVQQITDYFAPTDSVVRTFEYSFPLEAFQRLYLQQIPLSALDRWRSYLSNSCPLAGSGTVKGTNLDCLVNRTLIGSHLFGELAAMSGAAIGYQQVRVYYTNNGHSRYEYNLSQYTNQYAQLNTFPVVADNPLYYVANGTLAAEEHYNQAGQIQQKTSYEYDQLAPVARSAAPAIKFVVENCVPCVPSPGFIGCPHEPISVLFDNYTRQTVRQLLRSKSHYQYNQDGTGELLQTTHYTYGNQHQQAIRTATQNSRGDSLIAETRFVKDLIINPTASYTGTAAVLQRMRQRNLNAPVEQLQFIKKSGQSESQKKAIGGSYTQFERLNGNDNFLKPTGQYSLQVPDAVAVTPVHVSGGALSYDSQYELRQQYSYLTTGAAAGLLQSENVYKAPPTEYQYNNALLLSRRIDALGTPQAQNTFYQHNELFGLQETTNTRGITTEFAYDGLGRLLTVKDLLGNVVKGYDYQYYTNASAPTNTVFEYTPRVGGGSLPSGFANLETNVGYIDGLGRSLQMVSKQAGFGGNNDIVTNAQTYDPTGRPKRNYVPFANSGSGSLAALPATVHGDSAAYSENSLFDDSPLKRPTKAFGPGKAWRTADKATLMSYGTAGEQVRNYVVTSTGASATTNYAPATLLQKTTTNERGLSTVEFTDKNGQVVERWTPDSSSGQYLKTAYVYDDLGRLRYVVPPKAHQAQGDFDENSDYFRQGIYAYRYDARGRVTQKQVPGANWEYMVYDVLDRPALRQNARQRTDNRWSFSKYDALGRVIQTGETSQSSSRSALQTQFNAVATPYETSVGGSQSFPFALQANDLQTESYYDDYAALPSGFGYAGGYLAPHTSAKGLPTGGRVRNSINNDWLYSATYYNYQDRPVQQHRQNHLGATDRTDFDYLFAGEITKQRTTYRRANASDLTLLHEYEYDHVGRKTKYFHSIGNARVEIAHYNYDAVGRLIEKKLRPDRTYQRMAATPATITRNAPPPSNTNDIASQWILLSPGFNTTASGSNTYLAQIGIANTAGTLQGLQTIQYNYHIRNYLRAINGGKLNNDENDLFAYTLDYEDDGTYFDGNIRKQTWLTAQDQQVRNYTYTYDRANRLTAAKYVGKTPENYDLQKVAYDANGNITTLWQNGFKGNGSFGRVDELSFDYTNSVGNKLAQVSDTQGTANIDVSDFRDRSNVTNEYDYWPDGSLKQDLNKEITQIDYNYLGLTSQITLSAGRNIAYLRDGGGQKIRKQNSLGQVWDYVGECIYLDGQLYETTFGEGRLKANGGGFGYEFQYQDHLGSLRLAFRDSLAAAVNGVYAPPVIVQTNAYLPFGGRAAGLDNEPVGQDLHTFGTKERQDDFGINLHDFEARFSDPTIGNRFLQQDLLAEISRRFSPYIYANSNPLNFIDPDGLTSRTIYDLEGKAHEIGDDEVSNVYTAPQEGDEKEKGVTSSKPPQSMMIGQNVYKRQEDGTYQVEPNGITPDYTLESTVISGKILGPLFGKLATILGFGSKFGSLSVAGKYGINSYSTLRTTVIDQLGKGSGMEVHHLIEQRFASLLGQNSNNMLSIVVTRTEHDIFSVCTESQK